MFKNFFVNPMEQQNNAKQMLPSYVKEDGTKVYEKDDASGHIVC